ncbi:MAG: hypothetical protein ABIX01_15705 [Chitinophagaceae bacterium]
MFDYFSLINTKELDDKIASGQFPFRQNLFWDTPIQNISIPNNKRYMVERVVIRGFLADFYVLVHIYEAEEIREALRKSKELDPKTINFCSIYFNIPKSEMHVASFYY